MRTIRTLLLTFISTASLLIPISEVHALEPLQGILDCSTTTSGTCIESIYINTQDGRHVKAELTGRKSHMTLQYAPESINDSDLQEYSAPGFTFGGKAGSDFIPQLTYFPIGNRDCFYTPCVEGKEYIQVNTDTSWINGNDDMPAIHFAFRSTDLVCGSQTTPSLCYQPRNFGSDIEFEYHLRLPADFTYTDINARGARTFSSEKIPGVTSIDGKNYQTSIFKIRILPYSGFATAGADIDQQYGVGESDQADFVLWGKNSNIVKGFGSCSSIQGISVASNAFWADIPIWNAQDQALSVQLHGAHFKSDGSLNVVYFQARVTTAMAKCLWGVDLGKKISTSIQITYDNGSSPDVQTANAQLEGNDFVFSVTGMHLSAPVVKMKLAGEPKPSAPIDPALSAKPGTPGGGSQFQKILCQKGKMTKIVTGSKPNCPAGFKRK